jgi:hypothetical protein
MILNISYTNKKNSDTIDRILGKSFGFVRRLKMGGIGSPRLNLTDADEEVSKLMNRDNNRNVCNIELRPKGIIVGFRSRLDPYVLLMPYETLLITRLNLDQYRLESEKYFIVFHVRKNEISTHNFIHKLVDAQRTALHRGEA